MGLDMDFLATEILPRVSGKTLSRCKCVCKSFNAIISSSIFIQKHIQFTTTRSQANRLLILPYKDETDITTFGYDLDGRESPIRVSCSGDDVIGSSNGFLCVRSTQDRCLSVINLITQQCIRLNCRKYFLGSSGFGFDDRRKDYKLIVVIDKLNWDKTKDRLVFYVSLRDNTNGFLGQLTNVKDSLVAVGGSCGGGVLINNGLLHWLFSGVYGFRIGRFDIRVNRWVSDVQLPENYHDSSEFVRILSIGVVDGLLYCSLRNEVDFSYEAWVMEEYGVKESWFRLLRVPISDLFPGGVDVVARVGGDRVLVKQRHGCGMFWYNTKDGSFTDSCFAGVPYVTPHVYKNTFVTVNEF